MIKNNPKFIYFIIFLIFIIISIWAYISIFFYSIDRSAYLEAVSWKVYINENQIEIWDRKKLAKKDIIETKTKDSFAVIEWWDWSLTRLWWNTRIEIEEEFVSKNWNNVNILFKLTSWKTWSNVVSYISEDSYFKQVFNDNEAAVRWTIFTVDLEKDYLQVDSHKVTIKNEKLWEVEVLENKQLKLSDFKFISLQDFIQYFKDKWFFDLNKKLDREYFIKLSLDLEKNFTKISNIAKKEFDNLTKEQRKLLYTEFMEQYQKLNYVSLDMSEKLFNLKMNLKEKLISLAPESEKKNILNTLNYDLKNIFDLKDFTNFEKITNILKENEKYLDKKQLEEFFSIFNIKFEFRETINDTIIFFEKNVLNNPEYKKIFDSLKNNLSESIEEQKNVFLKFWEFLKNLF